MELKISPCGLVCSRCDAYRATQMNDQTKIETVAADWRRRYHCETITAADVRCGGCLTDGGPHCHHCSECHIRRCAQEKNVTHCGQCGDFPCKQLQDFFAYIPEQGEAMKNMLAAVAAVENRMESSF